MNWQKYISSRVSSITDNAQVPQSRRLSVDEGKFVFVEKERTTGETGVYSKIDMTEPKNTESYAWDFLTDMVYM